jgi:hypothetical protein
MRKVRNSSFRISISIAMRLSIFGNFGIGNFCIRILVKPIFFFSFFLFVTYKIIFIIKLSLYKSEWNFTVTSRIANKCSRVEHVNTILLTFLIANHFIDDDNVFLKDCSDSKSALCSAPVVDIFSKCKFESYY